MKVDIIILTAGKGNFIEKCLDSIVAKADTSKIGKVFVGCTTDEAFSKVQQLKSAHWLGIEPERMEYHFAKCCNYLASKCTSEALLFMNDDIELLEDAISPCLEVLEKDSRTGTVGIKLLYENMTIQHGGIFFRYKKDGTFEGVGHIGWKHNDFAMPDFWTAGNTGAFMMVRAEDFKKAGGFPEHYKVCFEDVEFNINVIAECHKMNVTLNHLKAMHYESKTRGHTCFQSDVDKIHKFFNQNVMKISCACQGTPIYQKYEGVKA